MTMSVPGRAEAGEPRAAEERCGGGCGGHDAGSAPAAPATPMPAELAAMQPELVVDLDVRDDLRNGREPFSRIMAARRAMPAGGALRLRAIFEPAPLYTVLGRQGLAHWTQRLAADDWVIWFFDAAATTPAGGPAAGPDRAAAPSESPAAAEPMVLDVRGLEPPEPMVRTLEALAALPAGGTLIQINVRVPHMLLPHLEARGFAYQVHQEADDRVRVVIHARAD
jgi:uncharacterized protein (DUF2249 family)